MIDAIDGGRSHLLVITSGLQIARELWRYGEHELAERAKALAPEEVVKVGNLTSRMHRASAFDRIWPDWPRPAALPLAAIAYFEGVPRRPKRSRRLPEASLPEHLQASEERLIDAWMPVFTLLQQQVADEQDNLR